MKPFAKAVLITVALGASIVYAGSPITYTFTQTATGKIGSTPFTSAALTITVVGNTGSVVFNGGSSVNYSEAFDANTASLSISGVGSGTVIDSGSINDNQAVFGGAVNFYDSSGGTQFTLSASVFASYVLATAIGPIGPQASVGGWGPVSTSLGPLIVTSARNLIFQAQGPVFPHLAMGPLGSDVWTTAIILNNTTASPAPFTIDFVQDNGQPLPLGSGIYNETGQAGIVQAQNGQSASGTIPANGSLTEVLSSSTFMEGWATLSAPGVTGQAVFHRHTSAGADYEATVPLSMGGTEYRVPFDATSYFNGTTHVTTLPYITGMALVNLDASTTATISCAILDPNGASLGSAAPITLPPMGHTALQLNAGSGFGNVVGNIGSLDCSSGGPLFAVLGLRFLGANDLTSFAAIKLY